MSAIFRVSPFSAIQARGYHLLRPASLGRLVTFIPKAISLHLADWVLNSCLKEQLEEGVFDYLQGRLLLVEITDAKVAVLLGAQDSRLRCEKVLSPKDIVESVKSDATLSLDTLSAVGLMQQEVDPDTLFFQRKLRIQGDTELAHQVKNTLDTLPPETIPSLIRQMMSKYSSRMNEPD
ncbi:ubiquinone anaerobic biosynthesis accessory factor UbiT [Kangiella spongicola]|uniref:Sterol-binding protein n=1 Tax=Kangiella spongicola TaxID=796379 RepID=A0A318D551_9GAMM|nr:SCP2 sterol-binding domain-containing protein [Kangiella spongicola]PXF63015.1 sterol-binding protein [Kangiella spongicola]